MLQDCQPVDFWRLERDTRRPLRKRGAFPGATAQARWAEMTGCTTRSLTWLKTGAFIRRRTKNASPAAIRSKTMEIPNTPAHPILGQVKVAVNGVLMRAGSTVTMIP